MFTRRFIASYDEMYANSTERLVIWLNNDGSAHFLLF